MKAIEIKIQVFLQIHANSTFVNEIIPVLIGDSFTESDIKDAKEYATRKWVLDNTECWYKDINNEQT